MKVWSPHYLYMIKCLSLPEYLLNCVCSAVLSYGVVVTSHCKAKQTTQIEKRTLFLGMARIQLYYCIPSLSFHLEKRQSWLCLNNSH